MVDYQDLLSKLPLNAIEDEACRSQVHSVWTIQPRTDLRAFQEMADNGKKFARHEEIAEIEWKLSNRPRKSLGYLTPMNIVN